MTDEQKAKLAQARKEARDKKKAQTGTNTSKEDKNSTQGKSEPIQTNIEYKDHVIVTEPHGRVMVTKFGLHVVEFLGDIEKGIEKAKEYIEDACK